MDINSMTAGKLYEDACRKSNSRKST